MIIDIDGNTATNKSYWKSYSGEKIKSYGTHVDKLVKGLVRTLHIDIMLPNEQRQTRMVAAKAFCLLLLVSMHEVTALAVNVQTRASSHASSRITRRHGHSARRSQTSQIPADAACRPVKTGFYPEPASYSGERQPRYWCLAGKQILPDLWRRLWNSPAVRKRVVFYLQQADRGNDALWSTASKWWGLDGSQLQIVRAKYEGIENSVARPIVFNNAVPTEQNYRTARDFVKQMWDVVGQATGAQSQKCIDLGNRLEPIIQANTVLYETSKVFIPKFLELVQASGVPGAKEWAIGLDLLYGAVVIAVDGNIKGDSAETIAANVFVDSLTKAIVIGATAYGGAMNYNEVQTFMLSQKVNIFKAFVAGERACRNLQQQNLTDKDFFSPKCNAARMEAWRAAFFNEILGAALSKFAPGVSKATAENALKNGRLGQSLPAIVHVMYFLPITCFLKQVESQNQKAIENMK